MTHPALSLGVPMDLPLLLAAGEAALLVLVLTVWTLQRRGTRPQKRLGSPAVKVAALAALACTAYSADTSWRFAADFLDMAGTVERAGMFAAAELALFATALMARQNLAVQGAPGLPGTLVWVITGVQVIPAYAESGPVGGTVRAFVGPVMAALLWHLAMGIELRLRTPDVASRGLIAVLGREVRERLLSRLGVAARDRDAAQISRDRATARAVALAARLAEGTPAQQRSWRGRRLTRRLSKAVGRASVGTDSLQRAQLLNQLAARRHALTLATIPLPSPWSPAHSTAPTATPVAGPHGPDALDGDRGPTQPRGPVPGTGDANTSPGTGTGGNDAGAGTGTPEVDTVPGAGFAKPEATAGAGTDRPTREEPAHRPVNRGPTNTESETEPNGDPEPPHPNTGTQPNGDPRHQVPLRRKTTKANAQERRGGRSRASQTPRPSREMEQSVDQLVQRVRPHVPALLDRDGNESVTRVQLREILRREGLKGGRNDRLGLVLQKLRSADTAKARSVR